MIKEDDGGGNSLLIESRKAKTSNVIDLYLKLKTEKHRRHIGTIIEKTRRFHITRSEEIHLLVKANAYGFNHHVISKATKFDTVVIHEKNSKRIFEIDRLDLLSSGRFMFFKQQGFELQTFVNRELLKNFEVTDKEKISILQNENSRGF